MQIWPCGFKHAKGSLESQVIVLNDLSTARSCGRQHPSENKRPQGFRRSYTLNFVESPNTMQNHIWIRFGCIRIQEELLDLGLGLRIHDTPVGLKRRVVEGPARESSSSWISVVQELARGTQALLVWMNAFRFAS